MIGPTGVGKFYVGEVTRKIYTGWLKDIEKGGEITKDQLQSIILDHRHEERSSTERLHILRNEIFFALCLVKSDCQRYVK